MLHSNSLADRYTAAKAFSYIKHHDMALLVSRLSDGDEHIYVKLEAAATLARHGNKNGYDFISPRFAPLGCDLMFFASDIVVFRI